MKARPTAAVTLLILLLGALALGLTACGGGGDSTAGSTTGNEASTGDGSGGGSEPTKAPIKIGMANATTGVADGAQDAPNVDVANAWVEWVNAEGGIQGHPVELTIRDSKNDTATASRVAKEFISEGIAAEVGGGDTVAGQVWADALNKAKVPVVGGEITLTPELVEQNQYLFSTIIQVINNIELFADEAKAVGAKKVGMVLCSESVTCTGAAEIMQPRVEKDGMEWGGYVQVAAGEASYTAACLALKQKGIDYLFLGLPATTGEKVVSDCLQQGVEFEYWGVSGGGVNAKSLTPLSEQGPKFNASFEAFPWFEETPAIKQYREVMAEYAPDAYYENAIQSNVWTAFQMFRYALEQMKLPEEVTSEVVLEGLWKVKNTDLEGLLPEKVSYTKGKTSVPIECSWNAQMVDAEFENPKVFCLKE